jgi:hypothetical protein
VDFAVLGRPATSHPQEGSVSTLGGDRLVAVRQLRSSLEHQEGVQRGTMATDSLHVLMHRSEANAEG